MTMSQRSSGSQRAPVTEDERLLTSAPQAERRGFTRTDPWRGVRVPGGVVGGVDTLPPAPHPPPNFCAPRPPAPGPLFQRGGGEWEKTPPQSPTPVTPSSPLF